MMKQKLIYIALFLLLSGTFLLAQPVLAQIPQTISYQGALTNAAGETVDDGQYILTFKLYNVNEGGENLWVEMQDVPVAGGIFNVILGRNNPSDLPFDKTYWLGVAIGGDAPDNYSVMDLAVRETSEGDIRVLSKVKNWSTSSERPTTVKLVVNGAEMGRETISVKPRNASQVSLRFTPGEARLIGGWLAAARAGTGGWGPAGAGGGKRPTVRTARSGAGAMHVILTMRREKIRGEYHI